jgi:6-phosphogluconolactonase (cycloisomerase 2 family)
MKRLIGYTAVLCLLAITVGCGGVTSTGTLAYISNSNGTGFTVYQVNNDGTLTLSSISPQDTPTSAGDGPKQIVFAANGKWAYYLDGAGTNLYGYKRSGNGTLTTSIPFLPYPLAGASSLVISPNSTFIYVSLPNAQTGELQVLSIDPSTGELSGGTPVQVGYPIDQLTMNSGGTVLYGLSKSKQSVVSWTLNSTNGNVTQTASTPVGPDPSFMILAANGNYMYVLDKSTTTTIYDQNGKVLGQSPNIYGFTTASGGVLSPMAGSSTSGLAGVFNENADPVTGIFPTKPMAGATTNDSRYLYVANQGTQNVSIFKINTATQLGEPIELLPSVSTVNGTTQNISSPYNCGCQTPSYAAVALGNNGLFLLDTPAGRIYQYRIDQNTGRIRAQNPAYKTAESSTSNPTWITIR